MASLPSLTRLATTALVPVLLVADGSDRPALLQRLANHGPADGPSIAVSANGRFVAFTSSAALLPDDTNPGADVYVVDLETGHLERGSRTGSERVATFFGNRYPSLSGDGRLLAFDDVLVDGRGARRAPVLLDRATGVTRPVAMGVGRTPADGTSRQARVGVDGRHVVFTSSASNLADGLSARDPNEDVYLLDVPAGHTARVSVDDAGGTPAHGTSHSPASSATGRFVAFVSTADLDRTRGDAPRIADRDTRASPAAIYLRDRVLGTTRRVSNATDGGRPNGPSAFPSLSADGRFVAFVSEANNLVRQDRNRRADVFVVDTATGATSLVSRRAGGGSASGASRYPVLSADGRVVVFQSDAPDLVCARRCTPRDEDVNLVSDVYRHDRDTGTTTRVSRDPDGPWVVASFGPAVDAAGTLVVFSSFHSTGTDDLRHDADAFVWRVGGGTLTSSPLTTPW